MEEDLSFCRGGGCTAKLGPDILKKVLSVLPETEKSPDLLVGFDTNDDAAVYRLSEHEAVVQTLDFFPPVVKDPFTFGQIAAANAMSDIWAMGAKPLLALNIVCFPQEKNLNILGKIMQGGAEKVKEAGAFLCGGHSINDREIKYGMSVTGTVDPDRILKNVGAEFGDRLILTKPLGTGIVCTADRIGKADPESMKEAVRSMTTLNRYAADVLKQYRVHACTDITGFGLLGHLSEMLGETKSALLYSGEIPFFKNVPQYADDFYITANAQRNRNHLEGCVDFGKAEFWQEELLFDPQTSGGLLAALPENEAESCLGEIRALGLPCGLIGEITEKREKKICVI